MRRCVYMSTDTHKVLELKMIMSEMTCERWEPNSGLLQ